jgi:hypothetical protein
MEKKQAELPTSGFFRRAGRARAFLGPHIALSLIILCVSLSQFKICLGDELILQFYEAK